MTDIEDLLTMKFDELNTSLQDAEVAICSTTAVLPYANGDVRKRLDTALDAAFDYVMKARTLVCQAIKAEGWAKGVKK